LSLQGADLVPRQQLVNRRQPAGAVGFEASTAVGILAAPLVERSCFRHTTILCVRATHEVMDKDEFEFRAARFERALPIIFPVALLPREIGPDGQSIGIAAATARTFAIVIADHKKEGRSGAELSEVIALGEILFERRVAIQVLLGHERVPEFDVKVGLVRQRVRQRPLIDHRIGVLVEMRIRRHGKCERPPRRTRSVKRKHRTVRVREAH